MGSRTRRKEPVRAMPMLPGRLQTLRGTGQNRIPMAGNPMAENPTAAILHLHDSMFHNKELPDNLYSNFFLLNPIIFCTIKHM
ncbi:hypothetical protein HMPREF3213_01454 [Heyndrickxia coagulans]|uniref:Uncharacterized protein n=1 Tax=Heyndrickxia coagulans TaxID=1398 RepID=A0A133KTG0_HEYCO|nr:hypothetical protein HMPREF3213_01454 [Heyndrickxia coagulans]